MNGVGSGSGRKRKPDVLSFNGLDNGGFHILEVLVASADYRTVHSTAGPTQLSGFPQA